MSIINYSLKEINCKIVYYGPSLGGKTTNLQYIYSRISPSNRGKLISMATEDERTLFFDFMPLKLIEIKGFKTRFHLYTVPGQAFYNNTRKLILRGVDGVIFVSDSRICQLEENIRSYQNMFENLSLYGEPGKNIPTAVQYNKRDLTDILPVEELERKVNIANLPCFTSIATTGVGVFDTLKEVIKQVVRNMI